MTRHALLGSLGLWLAMAVPVLLVCGRYRSAACAGMLAVMCGGRGG